VAQATLAGQGWAPAALVQAVALFGHEVLRCDPSSSGAATFSA